MSQSIWKKYEDIFSLVADLPEKEREERLRELCAGDKRLLGEISALLKADEKAADFIESPISLPVSLSQIYQQTQKENIETTASKGRRFGAYRVIGKLGTGGMGAVYLAERADGEFHKRAAIKLVKHGADTDFNLRRFRHERQVLAALEHPNIARLLDGGTADDGSPFLVMEYVEGKPLTDYCTERSLSLTEKLRLFRQVLAAISYAHEQGVIHRDIKPGNILVASGGAVKLLDFGIAKIFDEGLIHDEIGQTDTLFRQMTPEYASPEQICGERITPASDIYSLGVVLYELLSGERPYKFTSRAPHEIARVICEQEIRAPQISEPALAEDLQYIALKALQKKPADRYAAVKDFDADIENFTAALPIRKTRVSFASGVDDVFQQKTSIAGSVSLAVAPFEVLSNDNIPNTGSRSSEEFLGIGLADALTTKLSNVRRIAVRPTSSVLRLAATLDANALGKALNADYVLTGRILRGDQTIRVSVQLLNVADDSILWAQSFDESETDIFNLQDSISNRVAASLVPQITIEEAETLHQNGTTDAAAYELYLRGRAFFYNYTFGGISAAENCFVQAIESDPNFALAHSALADFYNFQTVFGLISNKEGFTRAKESALRAIAINPLLAEAQTALAFTTWAYDWNFSEAERLFQKALELNPNYARAHEWFAFLLSLDERHEEAFAEMRHAERLDPNSPALASMFSLVFYNARRYEESYEKARRALALDPDYYIALQSLGWICPRLGKFDEAIEGCRRAVRICDAQAINKFSLALALVDAGQTQEARSIVAELEARRDREQVPAYYPALVYAVLGEDDKAFAWLDEAINERGYYTLRMHVEPRFDRLRSDPRFIERLRRIKPPRSFDTSGGEPETRAGGEITTSEAAQNPRSPAKFKIKRRVAVALIALTGFGITAWFFLFPAGERQTPVEPQTLTIASSSVQPDEKTRTKDPAADGFYLAGKQQMAARTPEGLNKSIELFKQAVERDPNFALAHSGLSDAYNLLGSRNLKTPTEAYRLSEEYAVKAIALDPDSVEARISLAMAKFRRANDAAEAERHFLRAIEINPRHATARHWYAVVLGEAGRYNEAVGQIRAAAEIEPRSAIIQAAAASYCLKLNRQDEALAHADRAIELESRMINAYATKSLVFQFRGDYETAREVFRQAQIIGGNELEPFWLLVQSFAHAAAHRRSEALATFDRLMKTPEYRKTPENFIPDVALFYHLIGDDDRAFEWLRKVKIKKTLLDSLNSDPRFDKLRADPRFATLQEKWTSEAASK